MTTKRILSAFVWAGLAVFAGTPPSSAALLEQDRASPLISPAMSSAAPRTPNPLAKEALRTLLAEIAAGAPNYGKMSGPTAAGMRVSVAVTRDKLRRLGPIKSIAYKGPGPFGTDNFDVQFANGAADWQVSLAPDGGIDLLGWRWVSEPPVAKEPLPVLLTDLQMALDQASAADEFSGAVLVARDGRILFQRAYGFKDRAKGVRNALKTRFDVASMDKMFTAVAVLQLVQSGRVKLDAPIGTYLADYPNKTVAEKVTVHQLLSHTGGTGDFYGPEFAQQRAELLEPADYIRVFGGRAPRFEPGSKFGYSNYGFVVLGRIIEVVSGKPYDAYLQEHVFGPAGMTDTGAAIGGGLAGQAIGYSLKESGLTPASGIMPVRGNPATNGYSTVGDMALFAQALMGHRLLDRTHTDLLITTKTPVGKGSYAYGFESSETLGFKVIGHSGNHPGVNGDLRILPDSGYVVVSLANIDAPAATRFSDFVLERLDPVTIDKGR
jgi:D-alanyl-D-alanine carboxypeptidase